MPNRSCDFCLNNYKKEPNVGYYKFSTFMKIKLEMLEVEADFICGIHFEKSSFLENGRLKPSAVPSFSPSRANLIHDHPYCSVSDQEETEEFDIVTVNLPMSQDRLSCNEEDPIYSEDDDQQDPNFCPNSEEFSSQSAELYSETSSHQLNDSQTTQDPIKTPKVMVWLVLLLDLFLICREPKCGDYVDRANIKTSFKGAALTITSTCNSNHTTKWSSSPFLGIGKYAVPVLNILIATYTFTTGLHVDQVVTFFRHLNCACPGLTSMYNLSSNIVNKVVYNYWLRMQASLIQSRQESSEPLHLCGDGSYDSRGFSARYCNYIVMDLKTKHVLTVYTAIKFQTKGGSAAMEPFAAKTCLLSLLSYDIVIASFTTDRSSTIGTMMKGDPRLELIVHEYDVWHFIRSVEELREKILSIPHHCSNSHNFPNNKVYLACSHGSLSVEAREKPWLAEGSMELDKLRSALTGKGNNRYDDLSMMTGFHHTGDLENFNSLGNKYRPKEYVFGFDGMIARECLAAIDHNSNINRQQAVTKDGVPRVRTECDRAGAKWHVREVKAVKNYQFRDDIAMEVLQCVETRTVPDIELPTGEDVPKNQSKVIKPSREELLEKHQTRLKHKNN